jgi:Fe-S cluster assembly protein SufD
LARTALPPLPEAKTKGWEFTDLSGLDLDALESKPGSSQIDGAEPLDGSVESVRERLGSVVSSDDPFVARNDAEWSEGAFIHVTAGKALEEPIRIEVEPGTEGTRLDWRTLIVLEDGAQAEVWESYGPGGGGGVFNGVTEIMLGQGANLRYVCRQELPEENWAFATQRAEVGRDASLEWVALGFGSARGKVRMETKLAGRGASAKVTGAYIGGGTQHLDYDTTQEHAAPDTNSDLAFRGVLADSGSAVWPGMIRVDPGAQRTDAFQECRNLLLSKQAHADAIPGLEIEADDVRCTHAAAVAQLDREQLHYLRAHGLPKPIAQRMIIDGFMQELVERAEGPVRESLSSALEERLEQVLGAS